MSFSRRNFLKQAGAAGVGLAIPFSLKAAPSNPLEAIRPKRLAMDQTIGLVTPASQISGSELDDIVDKLTNMGLRVKLGQHVLDRYGYLAGQDLDRADDVDTMFADPEVDAILATRGGWGCNRMLEYLDYDLIRNNPKIIMGYSDITSLLIAIYTKSNLVTFHGPVGTATWNTFTKEYVSRILYDGEEATMSNQYPVTSNPTSVRTIKSGEAEGILIGGNLSVLTAMLGSPYAPQRWDDKILFLEETDEEAYRVDRMLTQLRIAGVLTQVRGVVFGDCKNCSPKSSPSLTFNDVLWDHLGNLGIPAWYGSMIGHIANKFTMPIGVPARINSVTGTIQMLAPAVS